jgi:hypothetical protein
MMDDRFGITVGNLYEIVVFQAERSPTESNYKLTLDGFLPPRSNCYTDCGDEDMGGPELCDEGDALRDSGGDINRNDEYGACRTDCTYAFCGDGVNDNKLAQDSSDPEACDNGSNIDTYVYATITGANVNAAKQNAVSAGYCAPGCAVPSFCGDGVIDFAKGEECDDGVDKNDGRYGGCTASCKLAPYCGDGLDNQLVSTGPNVYEACDCGKGVNANCPAGQFENYSDDEFGCDFGCQPSAYCGDNIRNGTENCDGTDVTGSRVCKDNCDYDAVCGDGVLNQGEECDHGVNNSATPGYEGCMAGTCTLGPHCGDGTPDLAAGEECDLGVDNNIGSYGGCTDTCLLGPSCGDGIPQSLADEECDNGFNEDVYAFPGVADACGAGCMDVPFCGDGNLQAAFEFCDDGEDNHDTAYDGCTTSCDYGPYCGDGNLDTPQEECDDGPGNVAYSANGAGCGYDCKASPYCGDGQRNGPEQCDKGEADNDGEYGGCKADCSLAPYCGDGKRQKDQGEDCDDGPSGSLTCTPKCRNRDGVIR